MERITTASTRLYDWLFPLQQNGATTKGSSGNSAVIEDLPVPRLVEKPRLHPLGERVVAVSTSTETHFVDVIAKKHLSKIDGTEWTYLSQGDGRAFFKSNGGRLQPVEIATGKLLTQIPANSSKSLIAAFGLPGGGCVSVSQEGVWVWNQLGKETLRGKSFNSKPRGAYLIGEYLYVWVPGEKGNQELYGYNPTKQFADPAPKTYPEQTQFFSTSTALYALCGEDQEIKCYQGETNGALKELWKAKLPPGKLADSMLGNSWETIAGKLVIKGKEEGPGWVSFSVQEGKDDPQIYCLKASTGSFIGAPAPALTSDMAPKTVTVGSATVGVDSRIKSGWLWGGYTNYQVSLMADTLRPAAIIRKRSEKRLAMLVMGVVTTVMLARLACRRLTRPAPLVAKPLPPQPSIPTPLPPPVVEGPIDLKGTPGPWHAIPRVRKSEFPVGNMANPEYYMNRATY